MHREIEVKVLNIDVDEIQKILMEKGAKKLSTEYQTNYTYVPKNGEFKNGYLRIREKIVDGKKEPTEITYKENAPSRSDVRVNDEYTSEISSATNMAKILEEIGIVEQYKGEKERISYTYKGQRFDIDIWDRSVYPDPYMEIEFTNIDLMDEIIEDLGIDRANVTSESINELIEKIEKNNVKRKLKCQ
ncbi:MAG: class IV adenylate cyclase [Peptoniphilaceae bacterium]|nr:class IV adenylate cyclase [Peptoniphilaceae bacterium]MDY6018423.1 class IV adenylate cyclase [Anaerococcus sp.]